MQVEQIQQLHRNTAHAPDLSGTDTAGGDQHKDREKGGLQGQEAGTAIPKELLGPSPSSPHSSSRLAVRVGTGCTHKHSFYSTCLQQLCNVTSQDEGKIICPAQIHEVMLGHHKQLAAPGQCPKAHRSQPCVSLVGKVPPCPHSCLLPARSTWSGLAATTTPPGSPSVEGA